jgi:hypothetical protein
MSDSAEGRPMRPGQEWRILSRGKNGQFEARNEGIFDELVVDDWLHIEQMSERAWWMRVGDACVWATVGPDGVTSVNIERGAYAAINGHTLVKGETP